MAETFSLVFNATGRSDKKPRTGSQVKDKYTTMGYLI